uniref:Proton-coupled zinc antiporter SLC30A5 n=1 Tax=Meloidogyne floridensis TaxID=298350 RepID=A0A915P721_9BILA
MLAHDFLKKNDRDFVPASSRQIRVVLPYSYHGQNMQVYSASAVLLPTQKPFSSGRSIRKSLQVRIAQLALFNTLVEIIWFYGITFCGPFRSILVFEQSPTVLLVALMFLVNGGGNAAKMRGVFYLCVGWIVLFFMDSDASNAPNHSEAYKHQSGLNHIFYHILGWFGISDHCGGVLLLMLAVIFRMSSIGSYFEFPLLLFMSTAFVMIVDFYAEHICFQHVADPVMAIARWSPITMFLASLLITWLWVDGSATGSHTISAGSLIAVACFCLASYVFTSQDSPRSMGGHFIGISEEGMPLYTHGEAFLHKTSRSLLHFFHETITEILANSDSRRIFWFLCANLAFCGVEFLYGFLTNSLGLISDGFHMLFDCSALVMGLVASVMARWTASRHFSYGYGRVEVLSGFINALFLIVIAMFIFLEALERLYDPPDVHTDKLLFVAVAGLLVNLFGMYAFHGGHGHSHGGGHGHSHGGGHGHSHSSSDGGDHGHSHGGNANMQGVFLHVLADTLGSVFVIASTLLIQNFGWQWVDPLCSLILSLLILGSVIPLLKSSSSVLLQSIPDGLDESNYERISNEIRAIDGVLDFSDFHCWQLKAGTNYCSIHIQAHPQSNEQLLRHQVQQLLLKRHQLKQITVQVEKENALLLKSSDKFQQQNPNENSTSFHLKIEN